MRKYVFCFIALSLTMLGATKTSQAESFTSLFGTRQTTTGVVPALAVEPSGWSEATADQIEMTSFAELIAGGDKGDDGKGKSCGDSCGNSFLGSLRENTEIWIGGDAYRGFGDGRYINFNPLPFATGNSAGIVAGFNSGVPLGNSQIRGQIGASYGAYDFKGRTIDDPGQEASIEQQSFVTVGLYKRSDVCCGDRLSWGVVYDQLFAHQWGWTADEVYLSQIRGIMGYAINECNEFGVWGTFATNRDTVVISDAASGITSTVRAMNQANAYWRHNWAFGANTMLYVGAVDQADVASWQLGMLGTAPLSHSAGLYGNFTYVVPGSGTGLVGAAEEQWNASVGLVFYLGAKAVSPTVSGNQGMPLLPVATNGTLLITN